MSSMWGNHIKLSIFGESHAESIGVVIDGLPSGIKIDREELSCFMRRRQAVDPMISTPRQETDELHFLCGIQQDTTEGTPLTIVIHNNNTRSQDYQSISHICRPGHADYTGYIRYGGYNDHRGGGHFSGRLTAPLVAAGGIARQILHQKGILVFSHIYAIHGIHDTPFDPVCVGRTEYEQLKEQQMAVLDPEKETQMREEIISAKRQLNSVGGIIECAITGLPAGIGNPMFDGIENTISQIIFGIPAIRGIEFGNGFEAAKLYGSQNNDEFYYDANAQVRTATNRHGGVLGGITSGMPLIFRVAVKPTPTISQVQKSIDLDTQSNTNLAAKGRHDPCIVPRALACVEAAASLAMLDQLLSQ